MPKVLKVKHQESQQSTSTSFPLDHISASSMIKFSTNPVLFKVRYINKDIIESTFGISGVLGSAFHHAMEVYYGGSDTMIPANEQEAMEYGLIAGMDFLNRYNDGFIGFTKTIENKQKALDYLSFCYKEYIKSNPYEIDKIIGIEDEIKEKIDVEWRGHRVTLPVKLKGRLDKVIREDGKIKIIDYKTCYSFSDPDKIDGAKILQAVEYYLLTYAKYGEEPYSLTFEEVKYTKNKDGSDQVKRYEVVYAENELYFDFYFRFYEDMIRALNGEMVYVPNVSAMFDNEIAIISYIQRLDVSEEQAKLMKKHKVSNITDLLKKEMQSAANMRKLAKTIEKTFISAKSLNYEKMQNEEKIKTKMMEHGMLIEFADVLEGSTVDLYRFTPSIGLKMSRLKNYVEDVEQVLGISGIRVLAPIPDSTMIGFEVPRRERTFPTVPAGNGFDIAIGQTIMGAPRRFDIRTAPHMLVAGASGSGKSVFLNALIEQLAQIPNAELHLYDPKRVELAHFKSKAVDYQTEPYAIYKALTAIEEEMMSRYDEMEKAGARNIEKMPHFKYKFVVVDEFGELIVGDHKHKTTVGTGHIITRGQHAGEEKMETEEIDLSAEIERKILRLAQLARASGIHLIIATQRPSADVIKGTIKANFPTKVVFKTAKAVDSTVILDEIGAEKLAGKGDMLFAGDNGIERLQGYLA